MPTYLVHGFRWHRTAIRIHIALYNLDDAAAEWIIAPATSITLLNSFYTLYDFLPPSAPPVTLNGNSGGATPLVLRNGGGVGSPTSNSNSASTLSGGASLEGKEKEGEKAKEKEDEIVQPHPVVKPHYTPPLPHSKSDSNGSTESNETPTPTSKAQSPKPKTLLKSKTKSMSSLRGFGRRRAERPPDLPDLPAGGFGNAAVATPINASSTPRMHRRRSTSTSIKRPSTGSTDQSRACRTEVKKKPAFNEWSSVKLFEQFDPTDLRSGSQPYAYVADYMVEVKLGVSIGEEQARYEARAREDNLTTPSTPTFDMHMRRESVGVGGAGGELSAREMRRKNRRANWFEKLRDQLQKNEDVGWYVVVCGDEERFVPTECDLTDVDEDEDYEDAEPKVKSPRSAGFRNFWTRRKTSPQLARGQMEDECC